MTFPKNNIENIVSELQSGVKMIALVAPSFIVDFKYPDILFQLRKLGFDKATELTFGAKMINREYHKKLKNTKGLIIASPCPGIVQMILGKYPQYKSNLINVDSPMVATAKICKKYFPKHKTCFLSPCDFKKLEVEKTPEVDYVIDYTQLKELFKKFKITPKCSGDECALFNKFYNDYTKVYPLSGGLGKTAHIKGIVKEDEVLVVDGINKVMKFLDNPDPKIKFLDVLFCNGGCIGGPHTNKKLTIPQKRSKVLKYLNTSKDEDIPEDRKGLINKASGIKFKGAVWWDKKESK
jgi:iron only hydrogenase large subunit-like protein